MDPWVYAWGRVRCIANVGMAVLIVGALLALVFVCHLGIM